MITNTKTKHAFTLIEVLTYLVLFTAIIITLMRFFLAIRQYQLDAQYKIYLQETFLFVGQHLSQSFTESDLVVDSLSDYDVSAGSIYLEEAGSPTYYYTVINDRLQVTTESQSYYLVPADIIVRQFLIQPIVNASDETVGVRVVLELEHEKQDSVSEIVESSYLLGSL